MNIFYVETDPYKAAQAMVDKHVVKMILETAQLLSTAHRLLDGEEYVEKKYVTGSLPARYRNVKRWRLPDDRDGILYSATHINHPSAVWARQSNNNYTWLYCHFVGLLNEYTYRYGKTHKCADPRFCQLLQTLPENIVVGHFTPVTPAMPDEYKVASAVESYRNYYKQGKTHLHKWTKREMPEWMK
jgi:hypothetical protein